MMQLLVLNTAGAAEGEQLFRDLLPWMGLILLLVIVLVATIYIGRRLIRGADDGDDQPFTLQSLRDLHASGQLSDLEFQRARDAMIGRVKADADSAKTPPDTSSPASTDGDDSPAAEGGVTDQRETPDHADNNEENDHGAERRRDEGPSSL